MIDNINSQIKRAQQELNRKTFSFEIIQKI